MKTASRFGATLILVLLASTSRAALVDVGNGLINQPAANLTWVADADLFKTMAAADTALVTKILTAWTDGPLPTLAGNGSTHTIVAGDFNATTGKMNWYGARAWVNYLRVTHYKGYSDWRLPEIGTASLQTGGCTACVPGDGGFAIATSEWWRLYFEELGGTAHVPIATSNNGNYSLFQGIEGDAFWGKSQNGTTTALFRDGGEQISALTSTVTYRAWVVRDGQSVANPPAAPYIEFAPETPAFGTVPYNSQTTGSVRLRNVGTAPANIASITASGDFTVTHNCGATLAMNATCVAVVTFKPTELFTRTGTLTVNAGTAFTTTLSGTGGISASLSASSASVKKGKTVTLTWSSSPQATCVAVGGTPGWAGPLMASGSRDVSSEEAGEVVYTIRCTHDGDTLPDAQASVNIFYANVASGALDWSLLLVLALTLGLVLASRIRQATRRVRT
jgi:hypothetical protein